MSKKPKIALKALHKFGNTLYDELGALQDKAMALGMEQVARCVHEARREISWHLAFARQKEERRKRKLAKLRIKPTTPAKGKQNG